MEALLVIRGTIEDGELAHCLSKRLHTLSLPRKLQIKAARNFQNTCLTVISSEHCFLGCGSVTGSIGSRVLQAHFGEKVQLDMGYDVVMGSGLFTGAVFGVNFSRLFAVSKSYDLPVQN
ncbi:unnamed protein product [Toxocara canis]|uniref:Ysc84 domain-containing protein n=1 Tax=Toxocara canis TaxID=6265 RepID=A0A183U1T1_TOXCA|nr:unnamed protein product [Toxocara canis]